MKRGIMAVIETADKGDFLNDAENGLNEIVEKLEAMGKGEGDIVLKLKIKNANGNFFVRPSLEIKAPKEPRRDSLYFHVNGTLSRENENQFKMNLSVVEKEDGTTKGIAK